MENFLIGSNGYCSRTMRLTGCLQYNLNKIHWDRRVWQIGYRGPLLAQQKATGRPDYPVHPGRVELLRQRFEREWNVMRCLATPYLTRAMEKPYWTVHGSVEQKRLRLADEAERRQMPGEVKRVTGKRSVDRRRANIGNLLHNHRTVEETMKELINRNRFD